MIALASGFRMEVSRFSSPLRGVGVLAMPDAGLDTTRSVKYLCMVLMGAGVLQLLVPCMAVRAIIGCRFVADGVEVRR
jgi:hypothetical protein